MAYYGEVDNFSEEVRPVAPARGFGRHGDGVEQHVLNGKLEEVDTVSRTGGVLLQHVVREKFEEVDTVSRTGGVVQQHVVKKFEEVDTVSRTGGHHHHHGHHGHHHHHGHHGHDVVVGVTRVEEDFNSSTGEFHERKETFLARAD